MLQGPLVLNLNYGIPPVLYFFLLSVSACLKKKRIYIILMFGGLGSTWGDNFYMGTQNGSKLEI